MRSVTTKPPTTLIIARATATPPRGRPTNVVDPRNDQGADNRDRRNGVGATSAACADRETLAMSSKPMKPASVKTNNIPQTSAPLMLPPGSFSRTRAMLPGPRWADNRARRSTRRPVGPPRPPLECPVRSPPTPHIASGDPAAPFLPPSGDVPDGCGRAAPPGHPAPSTPPAPPTGRGRASIDFTA